MERPFGRGRKPSYTRDLLTMVAKYFLNGMILQVLASFMGGTPK